MMMLLLIGPLQKLKVLVGSPRSISDRMLRDTIQDLCINSRSSSRIIADDSGNKNDDDNDDSGIIDSSTSTSSPILTLRPESYHLFDPEFMYLSSDQLSKACDKMRDYLRNYDQHHNHNYSNNNLNGSSIGSDSINNNNNNIEYYYKPLVSLQALPIPHDNFQTIRLFLYQPLLFKLLHSSLFLSTSSKDSIIKSLPISSNSNIISRVLHLITLQIQCLHYYNNNNIISNRKTSNNNSSNDGNYTNSRILFYEKAFSVPNRPENSSNHSRDSLHHLIITGCCRDILIILCNIYQSGSISKQDDIIYYHGLNWILQQIYNYSIDGRQVISQYGISFPLFTSNNSRSSSVVGVDIKDDSVVDNKMDIIATTTTTTTNLSTTTSVTNQELNTKMTRQMQARQRATIEAQKAAAAALQAYACEFSDSDDDNDNNNNNTKEKNDSHSSLDEKNNSNDDYNYHDIPNNINKKHTKKNDDLPVCIICKENKENILPLGYLCYIQPSNVIKNILLNNQDYSTELHQIYRVISSTGCPIYNIPNDDHNNSEIITIIPYNIHIKVEKVEGKWFRLIAPYPYGYCCLYSTVAYEKCNNSNSGSYSSNSIENENDNIITAHETILSTDTTNTTTTFLRTTNKNKTANNKNIHYKLRIYLYPIIDLQFNKYGGTKLNIHYCGHVMHNECWDTFYASNVSKVEHGNRSANLLSIDIHKGESLCPLCKSVTNTLLPYTSSALSSTLLPSSLLLSSSLSSSSLSLQPSSLPSLAASAISINLFNWFSTLTVITDISTKSILLSLLQNQTYINLSKSKDNSINDDDDDDDDSSNETVMKTMKIMIDDNNVNQDNHNCSRSSIKANVNVVNDNQFYDTLLQQQLLSWHSNNDDNNNDDDNNDNSSHDRNINRYLGYDVRHLNSNDNDYDKLIPSFSYLTSFRSIHNLWSTLSYTLLCQVIKKYRQNYLYGLSLTTTATSSSSSSFLSGLDSNNEIILQQSLYLLRRVPLRLSNSAIPSDNSISSIYDSFISKPLFELIFGVEDNYSIYQQVSKEYSHNNDNNSHNHNNDYKINYNLKKNHDTTYNANNFSTTTSTKNNFDDDNNEFDDTKNNALFLNFNNYNKNDIYHALLSLPFEIIHTIPYPNQQIINHTMYLASKVDIPSCDLWPILKIPLLMQDLYMIHMSIVT